MSSFTINLIEGGGVEVIDNALNKKYNFTNDQKAMGISIYEDTHHDGNGRSLSINDQPDWLEKKSLTFNISNSEYLQKVREQLDAGPGVTGGSRRRSIPKSSRKYKKSAKRVFRKKSRSTRRR